MTAEILAWICLGVAALAFVFAMLNTIAFRPPNECPDLHSLPPLSVLIPARNEAGSIEHCLAALLESDHPDFEIVVLDDNSEDATARILAEIAALHPQVKPLAGSPLEPGWNGKQFACWQLAQAAEHDHFVFLDADVRLKPNALSTAHQLFITQDLGLLSGFPRQITDTWMEKTLIPMINFVLLGFLPFIMMRKTRIPGFSAGCGQFFMTSKSTYTKAGGHQTIQASAHDGVKLPRAYRAVGITTEICDFSKHASVRMYHNTAQVWRGLMKNATEGIGAKPSILPMTFLLIVGHVLPWTLFWTGNPLVTTLATVVIVISYITRLITTLPFGLSLTGALLHPIGVTLLVVIQWWAWLEKLTGHKTTWKNRPV